MALGPKKGYEETFYANHHCVQQSGEGNKYSGRWATAVKTRHFPQEPKTSFPQGLNLFSFTLTLGKPFSRMPSFLPRVRKGSFIHGMRSFFISYIRTFRKLVFSVEGHSVIHAAIAEFVLESQNPYIGRFICYGWRRDGDISVLFRQLG